MKFTLLIISILSFAFSGIKESPNDFDLELSYIVREFKDEILNEDECEKQMRSADDLEDEIEEAIKETDNYTTVEIKELKKIQYEAQAMKKFISVVGKVGNYIPSKELFYLANKRVGASISTIIKDKYCVDVISVKIGDYITYLGENNSMKDYSMSYKYKTPNGVYTGHGTQGLPKQSLRHIYNNRDKLSQKVAYVYGITCKEN